MKLIVNDEELIEGVQLQQVEDRLDHLQQTQWIVLLKAEECCIITYHNDEGGFVLAYRDGAQDNHYEAVDDSLTRDDIKKAFKSYLAETSYWGKEIEWGFGERKLIMRASTEKDSV